MIVAMRGYTIFLNLERLAFHTNLRHYLGGTS